jgi:hypothetical protein
MTNALMRTLALLSHVGKPDSQYYNDLSAYDQGRGSALGLLLGFPNAQYVSWAQAHPSSMSFPANPGSGLGNGGKPGKQMPVSPKGNKTKPVYEASAPAGSSPLAKPKASAPAPQYQPAPQQMPAPAAPAMPTPLLPNTHQAQNWTSLVDGRTFSPDDAAMFLAQAQANTSPFAASGLQQPQPLQIPDRSMMGMRGMQAPSQMIGDFPQNLNMAYNNYDALMNLLG